MEIDYGELGKRIAKRRKLFELTQEQLAERCELSATHIGHVERGITICSIDALLKICTVLDITPDYLLVGINKDDNIKNQIDTEILRCSKEKQRHLLNYIRWYSDQDI